MIAVEWRDIPGYEGLYQVNSDGQVKSRPRATTRGGLLKPNLTRGYPRVTLTKDGVNHYRMVHHLVMLAFIGEMPEGYSVNHINGVKTDNRLENLEYLTLADNVRHAFRTGLIDKKGEKHHNAKLTDDDAYMIKTVGILCLDEFGVKYLANYYGVSTSTIRDAINGKTFKHISGC